jgi:hypothetical protein
MTKQRLTDWERREEMPILLSIHLFLRRCLRVLADWGSRFTRRDYFSNQLPPRRRPQWRFWYSSKKRELTAYDNAHAAEHGSTLDSNTSSFAAILKRNANGATITPRSGEGKTGSGTRNTNELIEYGIQRDQNITRLAEAKGSRTHWGGGS